MDLPRDAHVKDILVGDGFVAVLYKALHVQGAERFCFEYVKIFSIVSGETIKDEFWTNHSRTGIVKARWERLVAVFLPDQEELGWHEDGFECKVLDATTRDAEAKSFYYDVPCKAFHFGDFQMFRKSHLIACYADLFARMNFVVFDIQAEIAVREVCLDDFSWSFVGSLGDFWILRKVDKKLNKNGDYTFESVVELHTIKRSLQHIWENSNNFD